MCMTCLSPIGLCAGVNRIESLAMHTWCSMAKRYDQIKLINQDLELSCGIKMS